MEWFIWNFSLLCMIIGEELIYDCKIIPLESRLGSNLAFFPGLVNLYIFPGSNLLKTARFLGYKLGFNMKFLSGSNLQVKPRYISRFHMTIRLSRHRLISQWLSKGIILSEFRLENLETLGKVH